MRYQQNSWKAGDHPFNFDWDRMTKLEQVELSTLKRRRLSALRVGIDVATTN